MALQIWLPLDGNLRNQGLNGSINPILMGTGISFTDGKIGQAALFPNNCNSCIHMTGLRLQTGSFAAWIKVNGNGLTSRQCIISEGRDSYNDGVEFYTSQNGTVLYFKAHETILSLTIELNKWYHVVGTFGNQIIKLYINGELKASKTYTTDMSYTYASDLTLGKMSYSYTNTNNYFPFNGLLNDLRIYDHVLSYKEVSELAKGLILHYPFNDPYIESTINLCTIRIPGGGNQTWGGHTTVWTGVSCEDEPVPFDICLEGAITYSTNTSSGGGASRSIASFVVSPSTTYTYSFYAKATDDIDYISANFLYRYEFPAQGQTKILEAGIANKSRMISIGNGWYRFWGTFTTNSNTNYLQMSFYTYPCKNVTYWIGGWQLEEKDHMTPYIFGERNNLIVYDCAPAGNTYDGTIVGTITVAADSPRYENCIFMQSSEPTVNNSNGISYIEAKCALTQPTAMTVSWWAKPLSGYGGSSNHAAWCTSTGTQPTDYNSTAFHHRDARFDICPDSSSTTSIALTFNKYTLNEWHHYVVVYDGLKAYAYKDGVQISNITIGNSITPLKSFTKIFIGFSKAGGAQRKTLGYYSDFRVYCTALSAADIKELYDTAAQVDKDGNIYTYEFKEG